MLPSAHITNPMNVLTSGLSSLCLAGSWKANSEGERAVKMSEEQTSYKVTDRRLFNPDGTPREVPEDERPEVKPEAPQTGSASTTNAAEPTTGTPGPQAASGVSPQQQNQQAEESREAALPSAESGAEVDLPGAEDPASFASFMMSIACAA